MHRNHQDFSDLPPLLDRRDFLKGISAAALVGGGLLNSTFASAATIEARAASAAIDQSQGLTWLPAWRLREMIVRREVSSVEVVRHFLNRIKEHDSKLNAFLKLDAREALVQAERADQAIREGGELGPLHGVPIAVKELFFVKGFPIPGNYYSYIGDGRQVNPTQATRDDIEVERLRAAGTIIVGVTVAALGDVPGSDPTRLPRNPWDLSRTTGGSSCGNAAAVAAGLVPMAIGDDGGGSIRLPSAFCGLLGLHPTRGRVPHVDYKSAAPRPIVTVGPMTRSARDAAIGLQVLAGPDGRDFVCLQDQPPDYLATLESDIRGKRFAWTDDFGFARMPDALRSQQVISAIRATTGVLQQAGGTVTEIEATWEPPLVSWLVAGQLASGSSVPGSSENALSETAVMAALESRQRNWQRFREIFAKHDFVISPTIQFTAPTIDAWIEMCKQVGGQPKHLLVLDTVAAHTMICNVLGLPAISIPAGFVEHLPIALQVIGRPGSEADLLQVSQAFLVNIRKA